MKHTSSISGIASFKDKFIATAGYDNRVILWNALDNTPINQVNHDHLANQCSFSGDGQYLVSSSSDYSARIWQLPDLRLKTVLYGHTDDVEMSQFSPDSRLVATCSRDHTIRVFDLNGETRQVMRGHEADVISVSWSACGTSLISSSDDGTIRTWDVDSGQQLACIDLGGVETDTIALSRDGKIFAGDDEGRLTVIDGEQKTHINAHKAGVKRVVWDESSRKLISLSYDRSAIIWQLVDGQLVQQSQTALPSIVWPRSCAFLGSDRVVFVTFGSTYAIWNYADDEWLTEHIDDSTSLNAVSSIEGRLYAIGDAGKLSIDGNPVQEMGSLCNFLQPFGEYLLSGGQMGKVFDAKTGKLIHQHHSPLNCCATFSRQGVEFAVIGTYTGEGLLFNLDNSGAIAYYGTLSMHDNAIKGLSANGDTIFSVCATGAAAYHDIESFELSSYLPEAHEKISNACVAFGKQYASVGRDLKLTLWIDGEPQRYSSPHMNSIKCIASSEDKRYLATGSYGGSVAVFDTVERKWAPLTKPTTSGISSLIYCNDKQSFVASSYDGQAYVI
ncbi:WD40 repeat domain-containing protein [Vibrio neptunius]|uniref:WD40 repeat domain-containing protein n=1 Tax=Vibrio neptunius TaxID=170651 RepID=A0ABS2ZWU2_9VIBR|nr:WD40 repeat domain-containing protein [Vibrio neptunius]MBN3492186.1 WD40 repeat domain-containing protein [Vibrio neptunius]MBN3514683.1 WD40 repeat domain-containing protein [Vibrio neptunius]MBN3549191.1 WD40 repeat domain-containing protein [Vibrio neptunius]MBN3576716.1 WD40 repeat domain-containing protein [Vibrio neptunius]MCH9870380.1 WD40 repeat domain-containing protein [Vibrio neptunius]